jgi:hypothetical protein
LIYWRSRGSVQIFKFDEITIVALQPQCMLNPLKIGEFRS